MKDSFRRIATRISNLAGTATVFLGAIVVVAIWASSGPMFNFSDTWQLIINTGTTIVTFLMVFLIQNTQNRDGKAVQLKLDELLRATKGAGLHYIGLEDLSDAELTELESEFKAITERPGTARAIAKLQEKIKAEHSRRHRLHAPAMMAGLLHRQQADASPIDSGAPINTPPKPPVNTPPNQRD